MRRKQSGAHSEGGATCSGLVDGFRLGIQCLTLGGVLEERRQDEETPVEEKVNHQVLVAR